jgi:D-glucuronyl C5-epimerase-like protein
MTGLEKRHLLSILLAGALVFGETGLALARVPPTTGGSIRWTPLDPADLISRTTILPTRPFSPAPFRVAGYSIRTLAWGDLPLNGESLMRLATPPNADRDGIPYKVVDGRNYYSPGNIASDGVRFVDSYVRTGNTGYLDRARLRAAKLRSLGFVRDGALFVPYGFDYPGEGLEAPWVSAYAQGFALSLFVRLFRVTGEATYADGARSVFLSFRQLGTRWRPWVDYTTGGDLWLEEYPSGRPSHVLNGFNFALFGLYDYERLSRDPGAHQLLEAALATMRRRAVAYRVPGGISYYDLVHRTQWPHYHAIHVWQLRDLAAISGDSYFRQLSAAFAADYP